MDEILKYAIVVAGGKGLRMGGDLPKQFMPLAGKPVLMRTLEAFKAYDPSVRLVVVLPDAHRDYWRDLCEQYAFVVPHEVVSGGDTRFHSVRNGLQQVDLPGLVAVHDGVRPLVSVSVLEACFREAARSGTAIPVLPMIDSLREYTTQGSRPVDRSRYCAVQTPQVFRSELLLSAYACSYQETFTDDASVVEAAGYPVHLVPGNRENIKITTPFDLVVAEAVLAASDLL